MVESVKEIHRHVLNKQLTNHRSVTEPAVAEEWRWFLPSRDHGIMQLCVRIILRIIADLSHNWANPAQSNELRIISHLWMTFCYTSGILLIVTYVRYILTMWQCKKALSSIFRRDHGTSKSLSTWQIAVTDTTDSIVTANTTYTVFSQWSSRIAKDVITRL